MFTLFKLDFSFIFLLNTFFFCISILSQITNAWHTNDFVSILCFLYLPRNSKKLLDLDYTQLSKYSNRKFFIYTYRSYMKYTKKISLIFSVSALVLKQRRSPTILKKKLYESRDHTYRTVEWTYSDNSWVVKSFIMVSNACVFASTDILYIEKIL